MKKYQQLIQDVLVEGKSCEDRTGTGTISIFGYMMRFYLQAGFPLLTTKKLHIPSIVHELTWMLSGSTNTKYLENRGVTIWREWESPEGELGPVYGQQWRAWPGVGDDGQVQHFDQISDVLTAIRERPHDRGHIVCAWNVAELPKMALRPCHCLMQFYVREGILSTLLYQRSADVFLGLPFNIASYSLLTHMVAQQCDLEVGEFVWVGGDTHIYKNHLDAVALQLTREPRELPKLNLRRADSLFDYTLDNVSFEGYNPYPSIAGEVSV